MSAPGGSGGISDTRAVFRAILIVLAVVVTLWLIYLLRRPIGWMVIAGFLAIAVSGPINLLTRHMKRGFAIAIVYVGVVLAPFAMLAVLVPPVATSFTLIVAVSPARKVSSGTFSLLNPAFSTLTLYSPVRGRAPTVAEPLTPEVRSRVAPVAVFSTDTLASGTTAPV